MACQKFRHPGSEGKAALPAKRAGPQTGCGDGRKRHRNMCPAGRRRESLPDGQQPDQGKEQDMMS